jgi:exopolysaccharide production protein ExoQ
LATITAPHFAPWAQPETLGRAKGEISAYRLVVTYALMFPLLFFAVRGAFSFQYASGNNSETGMYGALVNPDSGNGSAAHSAELLACYGLICLAIVPFWRQVARACWDNKLSLLLPLWALVSVVWSQEPKRTVIFALFPLLGAIFGLYMGVRFKPRQQMQIMLLVGVLAALGSFLVVAVMPSAGVDHKNAMIGVEGIYPQKNICAMVTIGLMIPAFYYQFRGASATLKRFAYLGLGLALVLATTARTGWLMLIGCLTFIYLAKSLRRVKRIERLMVVLFLPAGIACTAWLVYTFRFDLLALMGKEATLSGRTIIWHAVFLSILKRPWTGFGYRAFWIGFKGEAIHLALATNDPGLSNAENGILQLWLEVGLVGVLILTAILFRSCRNIIRCYRSDTPEHILWYSTIIFMALLAVLDGDKFMLPHSLEWPMLILADAGLALQAKRLRTASQA